MNKNNKYDDIINLSHHISKKHSQMPLEARASQFAPFSALTGYSEEIKEVARLTNERIEIDEELKAIINNQLQIIQEHIYSTPEVCITYFVSDQKKNGGEYVTITGKVKKIDVYRQVIIFIDGIIIPINEIIKIMGDIFNEI